MCIGFTWSCLLFERATVESGAQMMIYKQIVEKTEADNGPEIRSDAITNGGTAPVGLMRHNMFR